MKNKLFLLSFVTVLVLALIVSPAVSFAQTGGESKEITRNDNTGKRDVINKFDTWTNLSYSDKVKKVIVEDYENNSKVLIDRFCPYGQNLVNGTCVVPNPPPPPVLVEICGNGIDDNKNGQIDENCPINPPPVPTQNITKIIFTGDVEGTTVRDAIKNATPNFVTVLGDLMYDSTLSAFKSSYWNVFLNKIGCTIGNHSAPEDGSSSIYVEAKALCKEAWDKKIAHSVILGFNSNGDTSSLASQLVTLTGKVTDTAYMQGVKNVFIVSHKPAHAAPNSHHPVSEDPQVKTFVDSLRSKVPAGIKIIEVNAHNHIMAKAPAQGYYTSGAGGKSHYECGTNSDWTYCNNSNYGYLLFEIDTNTGAIKSDKFYTSSGSVLK